MRESGSEYYRQSIHRLLRRSVLAQLFLYLFLPSFASPGNDTSSKPTFERILTTDGISKGTIYSIVEDRKGFLWLGTATGLLRYDGYTFKRYSHDPTDSNSISGDFIWSMCLDSSGDLWIGTSGRGINRYVPKEDRFIHYQNIPGDSTSLFGDEAVWVYVDRRNTLWAASWNHGLNRFAPESNSFRRYADSTALPSNNVHRMYEDRTGRFWVGTRRGLARFDRSSGTSRIYKPDPKNPRSLCGEYIFAIHETKDRNVWFGTDRGICRYNPQTDDFTSLPIAGLDNPVASLCEDSSGNLWVGTDGLGLYRVERPSGRPTLFSSNSREPESLPSNVILTLYCDSTGTLWIGTVATGLVKFDPNKKKFRHLTTEEPTVNALFEDSRGTVWIATQGGVQRMRRTGNAGVADRLLPPLLKDPVYAVCEDSAGNIWLGSPVSGLYRYDVKRERMESLGVPPAPSENTQNFVTSLFVDSRGDLWIGLSGGGVSRYDLHKKSFEHHSSRTSPPFPGNYVWAIHEDSRGNLWFGTWGIGVIRYNPQTGATDVFDKETPATISGDVVVAIAEEKSGILWFGTWGNGLNRFDPGTGAFSHFTIADGLPNDQIYGILIDDQRGELWLTTGNGLARFNPKTGNCNLYDESDGVQSLEFRRGAAHRGKSGVFYVGGVNGFNMFTPGTVTGNTHVPPIELTSIQVLGHDRRVSNTDLELSYDENFLAFEFAALDFVEPRKNSYRYRLEGLEDDWVRAGTRRYVSYANLPPGEYRFHVAGSNNDGLWNEGGAAVAFTIQPPPWRTWWAYSIYAVMLAGAGFGWRRYEILKIRRREREKAAIREAELRAELETQQTRIQIARDLHDEVGGTLSSIAFFAQAIGDRVEGEPRNKFLSLIAEGSSRAREAMSDIVWSIDPSNDNWETMIAKMQRYASELCESKGIAHAIIMSPPAYPLKLDPQVRRHLWLLFKEILTNSARHSKCSEMRIQLKAGDSNISLVVADNGAGFDPEHATHGHGLRNVRDRAHIIGAKAEMVSAPGTGTTWTIDFHA